MANERDDKEDDGLLPCPHCGGRASFGEVEDDHTHFGGRYIDCETCGASTNLVFPCKGDVERELRERWNRRVVRSAVACSEPWIPVRKAAVEWLARQDRNEVDRAYIAMEAIAMAQLALVEHPAGFTPQSASVALTLQALDRMIESVQEEIKANDAGNYATIGALRGEEKGLRAARLYLERASNATDRSATDE